MPLCKGIGKARPSGTFWPSVSYSVSIEVAPSTEMGAEVRSWSPLAVGDPIQPLPARAKGDHGLPGETDPELLLTKCP